MLKEEGKIDDDVIGKLIRLRHSGFSVHNGVRVTREMRKEWKPWHRSVKGVKFVQAVRE